jgi:hypothetical protein
MLDGTPLSADSDFTVCVGTASGTASHFMMVMRRKQRYVRSTYAQNAGIRCDEEMCGVKEF